MSSRLDELELKYGQMLAEAARAHRRIDDLKAEMQQANRHREAMSSETKISWRPLGLSVSLKNVAPWAIVAIIALTALIIAILRR